MTESDQLGWLRAANARWEACYKSAKARADSAEKWAHEEQKRRVRAERKWRQWRSSWVVCFLLLGSVQYHWPRLVTLGVLVGAVVLVEAARTVRVWWRQRALTRAAREDAEQPALPIGGQP